jgi:hypothetical protein
MNFIAIESERFFQGGAFKAEIILLEPEPDNSRRRELKKL